MVASPIPTNYPRISPSLCVRDATRAMAWYKDVLGAEETMRIPGEDGAVLHGELRIGDSVVMVGEEALGWNAFSPGHLGGTAVSLMLYVADVDATFARALAAGAREQRPPAEMPYGDRVGTLVDPFGHRWHLASRIEDVSPAEVVRRMAPG